jgi:hypothetical protein
MLKAMEFSPSPASNGSLQNDDIHFRVTENYHSFSNFPTKWFLVSEVTSFDPPPSNPENQIIDTEVFSYSRDPTLDPTTGWTGVEIQLTATDGFNTPKWQRTKYAIFTKHGTNPDSQNGGSKNPIFMYTVPQYEIICETGNCMLSGTSSSCSEGSSSYSSSINTSSVFTSSSNSSQSSSSSMNYSSSAQPLW